MLLNKKVKKGKKRYLFYDINILAKKRRKYAVLEFIEEYFPLLMNNVEELILVDLKNKYIPYNFRKYFNIKFGIRVRKLNVKETIHYILTEKDREKVVEFITNDMKYSLRYIVETIALSFQNYKNDEEIVEVLRNFEKYIYKVKNDILISYISFGLKPIGKIPIIYPYRDYDKDKDTEHSKVKKVNIDLNELNDKIQKTEAKKLKSVLG